MEKNETKWIAIGVIGFVLACSGPAIFYSISSASVECEAIKAGLVQKYDKESRMVIWVKHENTE